MIPGGDPVEDLHYLHERYMGDARRSGAIPGYYAIKSLLPRRLLLEIRRRSTGPQLRRADLAWPIDDVLLRHRAGRLAKELRDRGTDSMPFVNFWPDKQRFAVTLTHDVEGVDGIRRIPDVLEVERAHGFTSSWNFVAEWYPLSDQDFELVRGAGCEVGLHGIKHDGSLFRNREQFEQQLPKIRRYLDEWDAVGFRSPSTIRNSEWMHELPCSYDSSFPENDPFQPQPGGCCSIFPFFFGDVVELPMTLDQDHTLFELLEEDSIDIWLRKSRWLIENHGLINVNVHPDYMTPRRLRLYGELLAFLRAQDGGWHALPRDVAEWWRRRADLDAASVDEEPRATLALARPDDERIAYEI